MVKFFRLLLMRARFNWLVVAAAVFSAPVTAYCCEPIVPLFQLLSGSTLVGPAILTQSLGWLFAAVVIKTGAFILMERQLSWKRALWFMVLANVVSTIPGVLVAAGTTSPAVFFISVPVMFLLGHLVRRRLARLPPFELQPWVTGGFATSVFMGVFFLSSFLFLLAQSALDGRSYAGYWILKFVFVTLVAVTGIIISGAVEECIIARLALKRSGNLSFFASVFRANYVTLGIVLLVVAIEMLPRRLHSPHFITAWLQAVSALFGAA